MESLTLKGKPLSTNTIYDFTCKPYPHMYLNDKGQSVKDKYTWMVKSEWSKETTEEEIELDLRLYFDNKRKHDIDNYNKLALDILEGHVYENDSQIQKMTIEKFYDKKNPRIEIDVKEYNED